MCFINVRHFARKVALYSGVTASLSKKKIATSEHGIRDSIAWNECYVVGNNIKESDNKTNSYGIITKTIIELAATTTITTPTTATTTIIIIIINAM